MWKRTSHLCEKSGFLWGTDKITTLASWAALPWGSQAHSGFLAAASLGPFPALDWRVSATLSWILRVFVSDRTLSKAILGALSKGEVVSPRREQVFHLLCRGEGESGSRDYSGNLRPCKISLLCESVAEQKQIVLYFLFAEYLSHLSTAVHLALVWALSNPPRTNKLNTHALLSAFLCLLLEVGYIFNCRSHTPIGCHQN